jgi:serine/threonine protein kinase
VDFEREVATFETTGHGNVLKMYDFWEWDGSGFIAMKRMTGSVGDLVYESVYREILDALRNDERVLAELFRQVLTTTDVLMVGIIRVGTSSLKEHYIPRRETR